MGVSDKRRKRPEQLEQEEALKGEARQKVAQVTKDISETFASGHGQRTLKWIMDQCGYQAASNIADPTTGEILVNGTIYNEGRRTFYLNLRKMVHKDTLRAVEVDGLED